LRQKIFPLSLRGLAEPQRRPDGLLGIPELEVFGLQQWEMATRSQKLMGKAIERCRKSCRVIISSKNS
jgi:hypothetical protein